MSDTTQPPHGLAAKIAFIAAQIGTVPKDGTNAYHGYKYASDTAILQAVREHMNAANVAVFPSVLADTVKVQAIGDKGEMLTTLVMQFKVVDADSGIEEICNYPGAGTDKLDKGVYKAVTGAQKYFLQKLFNIPTGDDPEKDDAGHDEREHQQAAPRHTAATTAAPAAATKPRGQCEEVDDGRRCTKPAGHVTKHEFPKAVAQAQAANPGVMTSELPAAATQSNAVPVLVASLSSKSGTSARGAWTMYIIKFNGKIRASNGAVTSDGSTFDEKIASMAEDARASGRPVVATIEPGKKAGQFTITELAYAA